MEVRQLVTVALAAAVDAGNDYTVGSCCCRRENYCSLNVATHSEAAAGEDVALAGGEVEGDSEIGAFICRGCRRYSM